MYEYNVDLLCFFFWMILRHQNFMCRRFGKVCFIFIGRVDRKNSCSYDL
jgi:hypothetical protein